MKGLGTRGGDREAPVPPLLSLPKNLPTLYTSQLEASQTFPVSLSCMKLLQQPSNSYLSLLRCESTSATKQNFIDTVDLETNRIFFKHFSHHWIVLLVICGVDCLMWTLVWV